MNVQEILEKIAQTPERRTDVPTPPPVEVVAFVVRWSRNLKIGRYPRLPTSLASRSPLS